MFLRRHVGLYVYVSLTDLNGKVFYLWIQLTVPCCHFVFGHVGEVDDLVFGVLDEEISGEVWKYIPAYLGLLFCFSCSNRI